MPFPTVKSDPFKKTPRHRRTGLWPEDFWRRLVGRAKDDAAMTAGMATGVSDGCRRMIAEVNRLLYGRID